MADRKLMEERNKRIRERNLNISEVRISSVPPDAPWLKQPIRMSFVQNNILSNWDIVKPNERISVIVFNITCKKLVFVRQFQPPSYFACLHDNVELVDLKKYPPILGLTTELCNGLADNNKSLIESAQSIVKEQCRYEAPISAYNKIISCSFIGPDAAKQNLFYVEVTNEMQLPIDDTQSEDEQSIEIIEMSISEVKAYLASGEVQTLPNSLSGIYWFFLNKSERYT